jgi:hypothetical protein
MADVIDLSSDDELVKGMQKLVIELSSGESEVEVESELEEVVPVGEREGNVESEGEEAGWSLSVEESEADDTGDTETTLVGMLRRHSAFYHSILHYQPLCLEDVWAHARTTNIRISKQSLSAFLDRQGICHFSQTAKDNRRKK